MVLAAGDVSFSVLNDAIQKTVVVKEPVARVTVRRAHLNPRVHFMVFAQVVFQRLEIGPYQGAVSIAFSGTGPLGRRVCVSQRDAGIHDAFPERVSRADKPEAGQFLKHSGIGLG